MGKHRLVTFIAALIFVAAAIYLVLGLAGAWLLARGGLGMGWGSGWRGWVVIPVLVSTIFSSLTLLLFGAVLLFLARIENNLSLTRQRRREQAEQRAAARVEAPAVQVPELPVVVVPEVEAPPVEAPRVAVAAPAVAAELPKVEIEAPPVEVEAPKVEVAAPAVAAAAPTPAPPEALQDELAALRAQLAALQARLAQLEQGTGAAPAPTRLAARAEMPPLQPDLAEAKPAAAEADVSIKLPGAEEAARIAAEMAALMPPRRQPAPSPAPAAAPGISAVQPPSAPTAPAAREDDLEAIVGIGPTYARRLRQLGITTYEALAEVSDDIIRQVVGPSGGRVDREDWRGQARRLSQQR